MSRWIVVAIAAVAAGACDKASSQPNTTEDKAVWFDKGDHTLDASMDEARQTLPIFWKHLSEDREIKKALVKVGFPTNHGGVEFLWIGLTGSDEKALHGQIVNEPEDVPAVHAGQPYDIGEPSKIVDWAYEKHGKYYGQFSTRAMLKFADEKMRAEQVDMLSATPLEPGDR